MYKIYIDNQELSLPDNDCQTLAEVVQVVNSNYLKENTFIQRLYLDNDSLFEMDTDRRNSTLKESRHLEGIQQIKIFTNSSTQVASESIVGMMLYIDELISGMEKICDALRMGDSDRAFALYAYSMEGTYWIMQLLAALEKVFKLDYTTDRADGIPIQTHIKKMTDQLEMLVDAQEKGDWILMADILEYELIETFRKWRLLLGKVKEAVEQKTPAH